MNLSQKPHIKAPQYQSKARYTAKSLIRSRQLGFALPLAILIVVILIAAGGVGYYFYLFRGEVLRDKTSQEEKEAEVPKPEQVIDETADLSSKDLSTEDWKVYVNKKYSFSFTYPKNFRLMENEFCWGSILSSSYIEDSTPFGIVLLQDIYIDSAQTPQINLDIVKTDRTINQLLGHVRMVISEQTKALENIEAPYYGAPPPEIKSVETVTIGDLKMTKVVHNLGPGGPNPLLLEYYIAHPGYIFVFYANYSINCGTRVGMGDCGKTERETLPKILSTFKFIELEEEAPVGKEEPCVIPKAPTLKDPGFSVKGNEAFTVGWAGVEDAENYQFQRDDDSNFPAPFSMPEHWYKEDNSVTGNPKPETTTTYYYRVRACNDCGCSPWSNVVDMRVIVPTLPKTPVLMDPGASVSKHEVFTVKWTSVSGATKYRFQRDTNPDFSTPLSIPDYWLDYKLNSITGNPNPEVTTTYYYRAKACDDYSCSAWSNVVDMKVIVSPAITLISPNGGETWAKGSVQTIRWNSSGFTYVLADLMRENTVVKQISVGNSALPGSFTWEVRSDIPEGSNYKIRLTGSNTVGVHSTTYDESDNYFSIVSP